MIKENNLQGYKYAYDGDGVNISTRMQKQRGNVQRQSCQTIKTNIEIGVIIDDRDKGVNGIRTLNECPTQRASRFGLKVATNNDSNLRIRKLIPSECLALMGFNKDNYDSVKEWGDSALYHCAGDSIVVSVLMALFGELTDLDYRTIIQEYIEKEVI